MYVRSVEHLDCFGALPHLPGMEKEVAELLRFAPPVMPLAQIIEWRVTDCRGYDPVPRIRLNGHEDSLALTERLEWMTLTRAAVLHRSSAREWSLDNLTARMQPNNVDTNPKKLPILLFSSKGKEAALINILDGNIHAHLGPIRGKEGAFSMTWGPEFSRDHYREIANQASGNLSPELFNAHHQAITTGVS